MLAPKPSAHEPHTKVAWTWPLLTGLAPYSAGKRHREPANAPMGERATWNPITTRAKTHLPANPATESIGLGGPTRTCRVRSRSSLGRGEARRDVGA
jgi:hypothetical protein